jgi:hypothetical protein
MIFVGLVVMWLLILVPAVARHRQEVARPSVAALSGRVLERPPRAEPEPVGEPGTGRNVEVDVSHDLEPSGTVVVSRADPEERPRVPAPRRAGTPDADDDAGRRRDPEPSRDADDDRSADDSGRDRPAPRYRAGRGGYDPEAAALTARVRYAFRQRVVLAMLVLAVGSGVAAGFALPQLWFAHAAVDLALVGYLVYLRRQVRVEESIRRRRAARMGGARRPVARDEFGDEDRATEHGPRRAYDPADERRAGVGHDAADEARGRSTDEHTDDLAAERPLRVPGTGEPVRATGEDSADPVEGAPALPRLQPAPPPPLPAGTSLVEADDEDPAHYELDGPVRRDYRRASGE